MLPEIQEARLQARDKALSQLVARNLAVARRGVTEAAEASRMAVVGLVGPQATKAAWPALDRMAGRLDALSVEHRSACYHAAFEHWRLALPAEAMASAWPVPDPARVGLIGRADPLGVGHRQRFEAVARESVRRIGSVSARGRPLDAEFSGLKDQVIGMYWRIAVSDAATADNAALLDLMDRRLLSPAMAAYQMERERWMVQSAT